MKRRLFTILSALSLMLFMTIMTGWVRSYFRTDFLYYSRPDGYSLGIDSGLGWLSLTADQRNPRFASPAGFHWWIQRQPAKPVFSNASNMLERMGFWSIPLTTSSSIGHRWVVPYWGPAVALLVLPMFRFWTWRRSRSHLTRGLCPACGYDLRASKERCPECGMAIPSHDAAMATTGA